MAENRRVSRTSWEPREAFVPEHEQRCSWVQTAPMQESVTDYQRTFRCNWRKIPHSAAKTMYEKLPLRCSGIGSRQGWGVHLREAKAKVRGSRQNTEKGKFLYTEGRGVNLLYW